MKIYPLNLSAEFKDRTSLLKVLTYNVHGGDKLFSFNQDSIARLMVSEKPDVIFLCEYQYSKSRSLDSLLRKENYLRYYIRYANEVFYSKLRIDSIINLEPIGMHTPRSMINAVFLEFSDKPICIVGCHLSSSRTDYMKGLNQRQNEVNKIVDFINMQKCPTIILGDMNDISGSPTLEKLESCDFLDAWWEAGKGYGSTFHAYGLRLRLDHILYNNNFKVKSVKVVDTSVSDHNPLIATFYIK